MKGIKNQFEERKREFFAYHRLLRHLESRLLPRAGATRRVGDLPNIESFKAMKASAFLMLYNIVESTIMGAVGEIYKAIDRDACKFADVIPEIRVLWIEQRWVSPHDATPSTYRDRAAELLDRTISGTTLNLNPRKLSLGGNVDGDVVRNVCKRHGCDLKVHRRTRGGAELATVKAQRNGLAHGDKSFSECGQDFGVSDIDRISRECFNFLADFVRSLERFVTKRGYAVQVVAKPSSSP